MTDERVHRRARAAAARLARIARRLSPACRLYLLTDPVRAPDPGALAAAAPRGAVVIWRSFGAPVTHAIRRARRIAARRGVAFAVSADIAAARALRADGLHLPEWSRPTRTQVRRSGAQHITRSAHSPRALIRAARDANGVLLSTVFASASPSAGPPMGPVRCAIAAGRLPRPVAVALGGVTSRTAVRLFGAPLAGIALVSSGPGPVQRRPDASTGCAGKGR